MNKKPKKNGWLDQITQDDFYMENGAIVFKASYHLKRGFCCKSGCRHCPYDYKKPK